MWGYVKKVIEYIVFSCLVTIVAPVVMASLAIASLLKVHRKRSGSRYQKDPINITALVILIIIAVIGVIGVAVGVNLLANFLYNLSGFL